MGAMFNKSTPSVLQYYGTQIQSAVQALPIPIIYGAPRVPCNIIYANGFNTVKQQSGGKGGKGLLTGGKGSTGYLYYATLIAAIGEGPMNSVVAIYQDANTWFNGVGAIEEVDPNSQVGKSGGPHFISANATIFPGGDAQLPWSYIESHWPNDARGYKDTCYIGLPNMQLDSTATPPQLNFVPRGLFSGTCVLNPTTLWGSYNDTSGVKVDSFYAGLLDADPALCLNDFLTNSRYGAGFPAALIDSSIFSTGNATNSAVGDSSFQTYCQAVGFGWSELINNLESASSIIDRWTKNMAVAVVWTGATLKFIPYWDTTNSANPGILSAPPKYFVPDVQAILELTDGQLLQAHDPTEEPVTLDRVDPVDVYNYVRVSFRDRVNQFNDNIASDSDEVAMELYGPRVDVSQSAHEFSLLAYAQASATVQLRRNMSVRRRLTFRLPPVFGFFDPMDVLKITSGIFNGFAVRIISLDEDEQGAITVVAEEFPAGAGSPTAFPGSATTPTSVMQTNVPASSINPPAIFEPTSAMLAAESETQPTVVLGLSGSNGVYDPDWGGAAVYISLDDETYTLMGTQQGPSRQGLLTANLAAYSGSNPDNTNTLSVSLAMSGGELASTTSANAAQYLTLSAIIDADGCVELLAYTTANLSALNAYQLTGLYRGLFGTNASAHSSGAQFLRLDGGVLQVPLPPQFIGQTLYVKAISFNPYNGGEQDLSDPAVLTYTYVPTGQGTDLTTDPVVSALLAGTPVDLDTSNTEDLDLNLGGNGACGVTMLTIDLGS